MAGSATISTPDGPFTIIADDDGVLASGWTEDAERLRQAIHPSLRPVSPQGAAAYLDEAVALVRRYYTGDLAAPETAVVRQRSGPFREHAWATLRAVGAGETLTYSGLAARAGKPTAVRAAAGACAHNAAALFVPCHRIIRSDGTLGGFAYGIDVKRSLLKRERAAG